MKRDIDRAFDPGFFQTQEVSIVKIQSEGNADSLSQQPRCALGSNYESGILCDSAEEVRKGTINKT